MRYYLDRTQLFIILKCWGCGCESDWNLKEKEPFDIKSRHEDMTWDERWDEDDDTIIFS